MFKVSLSIVTLSLVVGCKSKNSSQARTNAAPQTVCKSDKLPNNLEIGSAATALEVDIDGNGRLDRILSVAPNNKDGLSSARLLIVQYQNNAGCYKNGDVTSSIEEGANFEVEKIDSPEGLPIVGITKSTKTSSSQLKYRYDGTQLMRIGHVELSSDHIGPEGDEGLYPTMETRVDYLSGTLTVSNYTSHEAKSKTTKKSTIDAPTTPLSDLTFESFFAPMNPEQTLSNACEPLSCADEFDIDGIMNPIVNSKNVKSSDDDGMKYIAKEDCVALLNSVVAKAKSDNKCKREIDTYLQCLATIECPRIECTPLKKECVALF